MSFRSRLLAPIAALALTLGAASPAAADPVTRVIAPAGSGIECSYAQPCSYGYALGMGSVAGDVVLALPGTYDVTGFPAEVQHALTVIGDPDKPRPVFRNLDPTTTWAMLVDPGADGTVLRHLDIEGYFGLGASATIDASDLAVTAKGRCVSLKGAGSTITDSTLKIQLPSGPCMDAFGAVTMRHLAIDAPGGNGVTIHGGGATLEDSTVTADMALELFDGAKDSTVRRVTLTAAKEGVLANQNGWATITDSLIRTTGAPSIAIDSSMGGKASLRNDTIVAAGTGALGVNVEAAYATVAPGFVNLRNVIVHASSTDLRSAVPKDPNACTPAPCKPGDITIDHSLFASTSGPIRDGGFNVTGDALFADAALGDFHLRAGSPAIDAGAPDELTGTTDFGGAPRIQGGGLDLGAFEAVPPAPAPVPPVSGTDTAASQTGTPGAPASGLPLADLTAPVLTGARVTKGSISLLRYRLSERAKVTIDIARRATKTRFRHVATLSRASQQGANQTKLRIKTRALKPGGYRATLSARDAAGNRSRRVVVRFSVTR